MQTENTEQKNPAPAVLHALVDHIWHARGSDIRIRRSVQFNNYRYVAESGNTRWVTPRLLWDSEKGEEYFDPDSEWLVYDRPPPEATWKLREGE